LPAKLTPHSLRRTFASLLFALGRVAPDVMAQLGHTDPKVTLGIYARAMGREEGEDLRLRALAGLADWAPMGTNAGGEPDDAGGTGDAEATDSALPPGEDRERTTGLEPATSSLGSLRSTN